MSNAQKQTSNECDITSIIKSINIDSHKIDVLIINNPHQNIREEFWCSAEVQSIDDKNCLDFYKSTSMIEYQSLCAKAKKKAIKKWKI